MVLLMPTLNYFSSELYDSCSMRRLCSNKNVLFTFVQEHLRRILRGQTSLFDWSRSTSLARTLSPRVLESQIDAKKVYNCLLVDYFQFPKSLYHFLLLFAFFLFLYYMLEIIPLHQELEKNLKATCEEFIMSVTKSVVDPMLSFVTKVSYPCN